MNQFILIFALLLGAHEVGVPKTKVVKYGTQVVITYGETGETVTAWFLHSTDGCRVGTNEEVYEKHKKGGGTYTSPWWERDKGF